MGESLMKFMVGIFNFRSSGSWWSNGHVPSHIPEVLNYLNAVWDWQPSEALDGKAHLKDS